MGGKTDYVNKKFAPQKAKTLKSALMRNISEQFPRIGGPRIVELCADMVLEVLNDHLRPRETICHGQVLWYAYAADDPPARGKTAADTRMVPVVLDLVTGEDIDMLLDHKSKDERRQAQALRLTRQAYEQKGILSGSELSLLMGCAESAVSTVLVAYERKTGNVVPRRATIHDMGTGLTHKRIICLKRYRDGKAAHIVAKETHHSLEAVDRYLGQFDRVRHCRKEGFTPETTAYTLGCGVSLVREYLAIDDELEGEYD